MLSGGPAAWLRPGELRRFIRFLLVGALNTLVGYGIFAALILLGLATAAAIVVGTILSVLFNFLSTGRVVFGDGSGRRLPRFLAVYVVQMGLNVAAVTALERAGVDPLIGGFVVLPVLVVFTYLAMRRFVFS
jgi:putative flippase GtrA